MLTNIPALPLALVGPLTQVVDVVSSTVDAVKLMRANKEECAHLVSRIARFLRSLIDNLRANKVSFAGDAPTAAHLIALKRYMSPCPRMYSALTNLFHSNLMAIRDDVEQWSHLSVLDSLMRRERIKVAISRHGENVNDCIQIFQVSECELSLY
jgi:hypothetical protein